MLAVTQRPPDRPTPSAALRGARLFRGMSAHIVEALAPAAHLTTFREGEPVWQAGSAADCFTIITRGLVQVERRTRSGEPAIVAIFGPSESIGDAAALSGGTYPADAVAASESVDLVRLSREVMLAHMEREPALGRAVQQSLLEHIAALNAKIDIVSAGSVPARLAMLLLHLAERFGDESESGALTIPLALSRVSLARLVSARSETVIRTFSGWNRAGIVVTTPTGFEVQHAEALNDIARAG